MWYVYKKLIYDVKDFDGEIIQKKGTWFFVGNYNSLDAAKEVLEHEIYLDNCAIDACNLTDVPQYKIESHFE